MNVNRILLWIRLFARAILDVLNGLDEAPERRQRSIGEPPPGFKPERIQFWIGVFARAVLTAVEGAGAPPPVTSGAKSVRRAGLGPWFKPERIQFWIGLIARFVLAVLAGVNEETGKSGERSDGPAPVGRAASEEADSQG